MIKKKPLIIAAIIVFFSLAAMGISMAKNETLKNAAQKQADTLQTIAPTPVKSPTPSATQQTNKNHPGEANTTQQSTRSDPVVKQDSSQYVNESPNIKSSTHTPVNKPTNTTKPTPIPTRVASIKRVASPTPTPNPTTYRTVQHTQAPKPTITPTPIKHRVAQPTPQHEVRYTHPTTKPTPMKYSQHKEVRYYESNVHADSTREVRVTPPQASREAYFYTEPTVAQTAVVVQKEVQPSVVVVEREVPVSLPKTGPGAPVIISILGVVTAMLGRKFFLS